MSRKPPGRQWIPGSSSMTTRQFTGRRTELKPYSAMARTSASVT